MGKIQLDYCLGLLVGFLLLSKNIRRMNLSDFLLVFHRRTKAIFHIFSLLPHDPQGFARPHFLRMLQAIPAFDLLINFLATEGFSLAM